MFGVVIFPSRSGSLRGGESIDFLRWHAANVFYLGNEITPVFAFPLGSDYSIIKNELNQLHNVHCIDYAGDFLDAIEVIWRSLEEEYRPICLLSLLSSFAPDGCVDTLVREQLASNASICLWQGLSFGVSPILISRAFARFARRVYDMGNFRINEEYEHFFRSCVEVAEKGGVRELTIRKVELAMFFKYEPADVPRYVSVTGIDNMRRLRRITAEFHCSEENRGFCLQEKWKVQLRSDRRLQSICSRRTGTAETEIRVLYVSLASAYTGASESLCEMLKQLPKLGVKPFVFLGAEGYFSDRLKSLGVEVLISEFDGSNPFEFSDQVSRLFGLCRPDVVHFNDFSGWLIAVLAKQRGIPIVYHARSIFWTDDTMNVLESSDHVIAVSDYVRRRVASLDCDTSNISVVYDGVNLQRFSVRDEKRRVLARQAIGIPDGYFCIVTVARLAWNKRYDVLLEALANVRERQGDRFRLVVVGESGGDVRCAKAFEDLLGRLQLSSCISRLSFHPNVLEVIAAADICVLCSEKEPLGTFVLESMASAVPVIVGSDGGVKELVAAGAGIIVRSGDIDELCVAIERLFKDSEMRNMMGRRGRAVCEELCSIERCAESVAAVYRRVTGAVMT